MLASVVKADDPVIINITGATAFRAAAHDAIIDMLGGSGTCKYAYVGATLASANQAIFEGQLNGVDHIVRTRQSGSTQGIADVVNQTSIGTYLDVTATAADRSTGAGTQIVDITGRLATAIPRFTFSDVDQSISAMPTPELQGLPVGVVPFVFVANAGAPAAMDNMTRQLHDGQWSLGELPLSIYTGNLADTRRVINVGRNSGSGTRATILSETRYGPFTSMVQYGGPNDTSNVSGPEGTGTVDALVNLGNGGYSSNSFVRQNLARTSAAVSVDGGAPEDIVIVSYLTLSDAAA
ncbi:MAG: hypothetical protein KDM64_18515, partial [Verrucomicrobiae bacterium]|nr:hypothetical protein [Verrucomicrobiae bacterium]